MKLCVTSTGKDLDSRVEEHFAQATYFVFVDTDTMAFGAALNNARMPKRWSGVGAAQIVLERNPDAVVTGFIGPHAFDALKIGHVQVFDGASGDETVREAVRKFMNNGYREASGSSSGKKR